MKSLWFKSQLTRPTSFGTASEKYSGRELWLRGIVTGCALTRPLDFSSPAEPPSPHTHPSTPPPSPLPSLLLSSTRFIAQGDVSPSFTRLLSLHGTARTRVFPSSLSSHSQWACPSLPSAPAHWRCLQGFLFFFIQTAAASAPLHFSCSWLAHRISYFLRTRRSWTQS